MVFLMLFLLWYGMTTAQPPQAIEYKTTVRLGSGSLISDRTVNFRFTILRASGSIAYAETQRERTGPYGEVCLQVGKRNTGKRSPL